VEEIAGNGQQFRPITPKIAVLGKSVFIQLSGAIQATDLLEPPALVEGIPLVTKGPEYP